MGLIGAATQRDALLAHLNAAYDAALPNLRADTIDKALDADLPEGARQLLDLRREAARVSVSKYASALRSVSKDGRLRGTIQYCGALRTGRWTGHIFNPLNMARPTLSAEEIDEGIEALKAGALELVSPKPSLMLSNAVRGLLVAAPGKKLVVSDLSNIEGRVLAWIAGEDWKLRAFSAFDMGVGDDLYKLQYARQFGTTTAEVGKDERQIGKVEELGLGYQGGVGAFITFAATYGLDLDKLAKDAAPIIPRDLWDEAQGEWEWATREGRTYGLPVLVYMTCSALKRMWRESNPAITQLWPAAENAARDVMCGGRPVTLGLLKFDRVRNWLRIRLPSERYLCYPGTRVDDKGKLSYLGINQYSKQWGRVGTYGGKIVENCTQAIARDIFAGGMLRAEAAGYAVVLPVHDEAVTETPDTGQYTAKGLSDILAAGESWTAGLPLAAHGFETYRYRKGE
jgi:DNA polymerase